MAFDLVRIREELAASPIASPYSFELGAAIVNDCFRLAGIAPLPSRRLRDLAGVDVKGKKRPELQHRGEQLGMLAHILASTVLREATVAAIARLRPAPTAADLAVKLESFFGAVWPLTAEMIRANAFRQEEFLRRWIELWQGEVAGESAGQSAERLAQLDYRTALSEYERAEKARKAEADRRAQALKEAQEREAAARGWRE
jgi:hypothetical protein